MSKLSYSQIEKITDFFKKFVQEENIKGNVVIEFDEFGNVEEHDDLYFEDEIDEYKEKIKELELENEDLNDQVEDLKSSLDEALDELKKGW